MPSHTTLGALFVLLGAALSPTSAHAQGVSVTLQVTIAASKPQRPPSLPTVVAWLTPAGTSDSSVHHTAVPPHHLVLSQKDKQFIPHLLVVPTGSTVEFPNLDPFFHNVFSLFNGRRFDLGLYEAGSRRSVRFDHDGVSFVFCNIHPEMGAVIVSLSTPYYAISSADGSLSLANIPTGDYNLELWSENVSPSDLATAKQRIHVSAQPLRLPPIILRSAPPSLNHLNKFGESYKKPEQAPY